MRNFTINDLERFTGVKAHTLRIWERRYDILQPERTPGNFRLYSVDQLKKILNIALLNKNGYKISRLSKITEAVVENTITALSKDDNKWQKAINDLTICMYTPDAGCFEDVLDELILTWPMDVVMEKIVVPFLNTTALLWIGSKLYEEHIVVTSIRKKLILAIEMLPDTNKQGDSVVLFLPDNKQLDLGLLYCNYFLKKRGMHVVYFGVDVSLPILERYLTVQSPKYIFTYLPHTTHFPTKQLLACMEANAPNAKFIIGEYASERAEVSKANLLQMNYAKALEYLDTQKN